MTEAISYPKDQELYANGYPFTNPLSREIHDQEIRVQINKASLIVIDGGVGEGKTTLAKHIANYVNKKPLDMKVQYAMGGDDFRRKLHKCVENKYNVIIYDEAGDFSKRGALTKFNRLLNSVFDKYRTFRITVILCLPFFNSLDSDLMDKKIARMLLHCYDRTEKYGCFSAYSLYRMYWIKHHMDKMPVKPKAYSRVSPNFKGHFYDLDRKQAAELDRMGTAYKATSTKRESAESDGMMTIYDMMRNFHRSKSWVLSKLKAEGITSDYKIGKAKYYTAEDVSTLRGLIKQEEAES